MAAIYERDASVCKYGKELVEALPGRFNPGCYGVCAAPRLTNHSYMHDFQPLAAQPVSTRSLPVHTKEVTQPLTVQSPPDLIEFSELEDYPSLEQLPLEQSPSQGEVSSEESPPHVRILRAGAAHKSPSGDSFALPQVGFEDSMEMPGLSPTAGAYTSSQLPHEETRSSDDTLVGEGMKSLEGSDHQDKLEGGSLSQHTTSSISLPPHSKSSHSSLSQHTMSSHSTLSHPGMEERTLLAEQPDLSEYPLPEHDEGADAAVDQVSRILDMLGPRPSVTGQETFPTSSTSEGSVRRGSLEREPAGVMSRISLLSTESSSRIHGISQMNLDSMESQDSLAQRVKDLLGDSTQAGSRLSGLGARQSAAGRSDDGVTSTGTREKSERDFDADVDDVVSSSQSNNIVNIHDSIAGRKPLSQSTPYMVLPVDPLTQIKLPTPQVKEAEEEEQPSRVNSGQERTTDMSAGTTVPKPDDMAFKRQAWGAFPPPSQESRHSQISQDSLNPSQEPQRKYLSEDVQRFPPLGLVELEAGPHSQETLVKQLEEKTDYVGKRLSDRELSPRDSPPDVKKPRNEEELASTTPSQYVQPESARTSRSSYIRGMNLESIDSEDSIADRVRYLLGGDSPGTSDHQLSARSELSSQGVPREIQRTSSTQGYTSHAQRPVTDSHTLGVGVSPGETSPLHVTSLAGREHTLKRSSYEEFWIDPERPSSANGSPSRPIGLTSSQRSASDSELHVSPRGGRRSRRERYEEVRSQARLSRAADFTSSADVQQEGKDPGVSQQPTSRTSDLPASSYTQPYQFVSTALPGDTTSHEGGAGTFTAPSFELDQQELSRASGHTHYTVDTLSQSVSLPIGSVHSPNTTGPAEHTTAQYEEVNRQEFKLQLENDVLEGESAVQTARTNNTARTQNGGLTGRTLSPASSRDSLAQQVYDILTSPSYLDRYSNTDGPTSPLLADPSYKVDLQTRLGLGRDDEGETSRSPSVAELHEKTRQLLEQYDKEMAERGSLESDGVPTARHSASSQYADRRSIETRSRMSSGLDKPSQHASRTSLENMSRLSGMEKAQHTGQTLVEDRSTLYGLDRPQHAERTAVESYMAGVVKTQQRMSEEDRSPLYGLDRPQHTSRSSLESRARLSGADRDEEERYQYPHDSKSSIRVSAISGGEERTEPPQSTEGNPVPTLSEESVRRESSRKAAEEPLSPRSRTSRGSVMSQIVSPRRAPSQTSTVSQLDTARTTDSLDSLAYKVRHLLARESPERRVDAILKEAELVEQTAITEALLEEAERTEHALSGTPTRIYDIQRSRRTSEGMRSSRSSVSSRLSVESATFAPIGLPFTAFDFARNLISNQLTKVAENKFDHSVNLLGMTPQVSQEHGTQPRSGQKGSEVTGQELARGQVKVVHQGHPTTPHIQLTGMRCIITIKDMMQGAADKVLTPNMEGRMREMQTFGPPRKDPENLTKPCSTQTCRQGALEEALLGDQGKESGEEGPRLQLYRPVGSPDVFYVPLAEDKEPDTPVSQTTLESTHLGSDDAESPSFPASYLGTRKDTFEAIHSVGIYGTRKSPKYLSKLSKSQEGSPQDKSARTGARELQKEPRVKPGGESDGINEERVRAIIERERRSLGGEDGTPSATDRSREERFRVVERKEKSPGEGRRSDLTRDKPASAGHREVHRDGRDRLSDHRDRAQDRPVVHPARAREIMSGEGTRERQRPRSTDAGDLIRTKPAASFIEYPASLQSRSPPEDREEDFKALQPEPQSPLKGRGLTRAELDDHLLRDRGLKDRRRSPPAEAYHKPARQDLGYRRATETSPSRYRGDRDGGYGRDRTRDYIRERPTDVRPPGAAGFDRHGAVGRTRADRSPIRDYVSPDRDRGARVSPGRYQAASPGRYRETRPYRDTYRHEYDTRRARDSPRRDYDISTLRRNQDVLREVLELEERLEPAQLEELASMLRDPLKFSLQQMYKDHVQRKAQQQGRTAEPPQEEGETSCELRDAIKVKMKDLEQTEDLDTPTPDTMPAVAKKAQKSERKQGHREKYPEPPGSASSTLTEGTGEETLTEERLEKPQENQRKNRPAEKKPSRKSKAETPPREATKSPREDPSAASLLDSINTQRLTKIFGDLHSPASSDANSLASDSSSVSSIDSARFYQVFGQSNPKLRDLAKKIQKQKDRHGKKREKSGLSYLSSGASTLTLSPVPETDRDLTDDTSPLSTASSDAGDVKKQTRKTLNLYPQETESSPNDTDSSVPCQCKAKKEGREERQERIKRYQEARHKEPTRKETREEDTFKKPTQPTQRKQKAGKQERRHPKKEKKNDFGAVFPSPVTASTPAPHGNKVTIGIQTTPSLNSSVNSSVSTPRERSRGTQTTPSLDSGSDTSTKRPKERRKQKPDKTIYYESTPMHKSGAADRGRPADEGNVSAISSPGGMAWFQPMVEDKPWRQRKSSGGSHGSPTEDNLPERRRARSGSHDDKLVVSVPVTTPEQKGKDHQPQEAPQYPVLFESVKKRKEDRETKPKSTEKGEERSVNARPGLAWYVPVAQDLPWRRPLQERQQYPQDRQDQIVRWMDDTSPHRRAPNQPPRPLERLTLQEALKMRNPAFISKSRERVRRMELAAEERRHEEEFELERMRLFGEERRRRQATEPAPQSENLHRPKKRIITKKEMAARSKRMYEKLPEVQRKKAQERRQASYKSNRIKAQLFKKKVLDSLRRKNDIIY
ncbi:alpha-actinin binding [Branchiostoma belcheri]|nr:alpha-actinin binding [Branchiostoma belcheri]